MREMCDLSHQWLTAGRIGRLLTIGRLPVIAGDSFQASSIVQVRLGQLRRPFTTDCKLDLFAFYCPYRYAYGDSWRSYIEAGGEEVETFPTLTMLKPGFGLGVNYTGAAPKHALFDYASIWNNYFKDPSANDLDYTTLANASNDTMNHGVICYNMKSWGTAQSFLASGTSAEFNAPVVAGNVSIFDIQAASMQARQKNFRDYMSSRYVEIMRGMSNVDVSDLIDDRPELVWRQSEWFSGFDVNGTSGSEFGQTTGKAYCEVTLNMPRRAFPEHGTLYFFALVRFPPVFMDMIPYLDNMNRAFEDIVPGSGPYPPRQITMGDVFNAGGATSLGYISQYDWYRTAPSFINQIVSNQQGWQFAAKPASPTAAIQCSNYDSVFSTAPATLGHYVLNCSHRITAMRPLPSQDSSIMGSFQ